MSINPDIFRTYDIRGIWRKDLTIEIGENLGKAVGTFFDKYQVKKVVVGRDNRLGGKDLMKSFIKGLRSTGRNVVDVGVVITPMIYFSWHHLNAKGTVMITASHNPPEYNGLKISLKKHPIYGEKYQEIRKIAEASKFSSGKGSYKKYNLRQFYLNGIIKNINLKRKLKVVVDCGNGTASLFASELFKKLSRESFLLFCKSDGSFPNHLPYPQKTELYTKLIKTIKEEKADLGFAFDGDGDRLGVYDEKGQFIENDFLLMILARDICRKYPGRKVIGNISTSLAVLEDIKNHGGIPMLWKTGYPFITSKMKKEKAIFGGEISGHFFFVDRYYGFDDALYAAARVLETVSQSKKPVSRLLTGVPAYFGTPEFRVEAKDKFDTIKKIVKEIKKEHPEAEILNIDGVRFSFKDCWGLIRASNTEPLLTGRAEAKTKERLEEIKNLIQSKLAKHGVKLDWKHPLK